MSPVIKRFYKDYRGCPIDRVVHVSQTLDRGRTEEFRGYLPRLPASMMRPGRSYAVGHPRSLEEVEGWIDRHLDEDN